MLKRLYDKSALAFALVWIGAYVVLFSVADGLSENLGTEKLLTAPLAVLLGVLLVGFLKKHALEGENGLCKPKLPLKALLYYLPLLPILSVNFWGGVGLQMTLVETALYVVSMLFVGLIEELIFRGLLFNALKADSLKRAVIISSVTFGIGHIVNLLNGAAFLPTLLQIVYATAIGFLFTILFLKTGSLLPCIFAHSFVNASSAFAAPQSTASELSSAIVMTLVAIAYAVWLLRKK